MKVFSSFDICSFVQISRNLRVVQVEKRAIFWKISHPHLPNFSIVCIILSSAHIHCFIYFSLSLLAVLKCLLSHKNVYFDIFCADEVYSSEKSYHYLLILAKNNISIVCIIPSSAHIQCLIYFFNPYWQY